MKKQIHFYFFALIIFSYIGCSSSGSSSGDPTPTPTPDITPTPTPATPQVTSKVPSNGTDCVATNSRVTAKFDRAMESSTLTTSSFFLKEGAATVTSAVTYDSTEKKAILDPNADLTTLTDFTAHLTTDVQDTNGAALSSEITWTFTTGAGADNDFPVFSGIDTGDDNSDRTATLTWVAADDDEASCGTPADSIVYLIYQDANCAAGLIGSVTGETSFTTEVLDPGTYHFCVRAQDSVGNTSMNTEDVQVIIPVPTWTQVYAILTATSHSCTGSSCHDATDPQPNDPGPGMNLSTKALAYSNTVNVTSTENGALKRIKPSDAANSYLYRKLTGTGIVSGTVQMPKSKTKLNASELETVQLWINAGAANN